MLIIATTFGEFIDTINLQHLYDENIRNKGLLFREQKGSADACKLLIYECSGFIFFPFIKTNSNFHIANNAMQAQVQHKYY